MTPNKLPPLPKPSCDWSPETHVYSGADLHAYAAEALRQSQSLPAGAVAGLPKIIEQMRGYGDHEVLRWSHELAAIYTDSQRDLLRHELDGLEALQADAREKGEAVGWAAIDTRGKPIELFLTEAGAMAWAGWGDDLDPSIKFAHVIPVYATQPAQASEKECSHRFRCDCLGACKYGRPGYGAEAPTLSHQLQQKCVDWGAYWRAPDAHGVILSTDQALELLRDALGVEVDIEATKPADAAPLPWDATHPQPVTPAGGEVSPTCKDGCPFAVTKGGHTICQPPKRLQHPPAADAALVRDAERYRWWRENIDLLDQQSMYGIAYSCQIPVHNGHVPTAELMDMIADSQDAALNQRGGGDGN